MTNELNNSYYLHRQLSRSLTTFPAPSRWRDKIFFNQNTASHRDSASRDLE